MSSNIDVWTRSDNYHNSFLIADDEALTRAQSSLIENGLPDIAVSAAQGKFLNLLASSIRAKRILEVGTLGGYSTIWLAKALPPDGELLTLELDSHHADVARKNIANAFPSFSPNVDVKVLLGPAATTLEKLSPDPIPFDFVFIDADKENNHVYFKHAKRLVRKGGVIIVDNVVRSGRVSDPKVDDGRVDGVRSLLYALKNDKEVDCTTIATVGVKGYDGFLYAIRR